MKLFAWKKRTGWLALIIGASALFLLPQKALVQDDGLLYTLAPQVPLPADKGEAKMEYALYKLQNIFHTQGWEKAKEFARVCRMDMEGDRIRVVIETNPQGHAILAQSLACVVMDQVRALGGQVETSYNDLIQIMAPPTVLSDLAANPLVKYVRLPLKPIPQAVTSEGVELTGADLWHGLAPYRNSAGGPKVGILDLGFANYEALLGTELPSSVTARSFRADGDIFAGQVHGTACAEVVFDMMPEARFYLVNFGTDVEQHNAVDWLISEGVEVISYSIGWYNAGDGAGTGPICEDVKRAADNGIVWVGAAGNDARNHWTGTFTDPNSNGFHNFITADEILQISVPAWTPVAFFLNWDGWGSWNGTAYSGSGQDYDMYLFIWNGSAWIYVDDSLNWQNGTQWPVEAIGYWFTNIATYWGVAIRKYNATRNCKLELFTYGNSTPCEYNIPEGSLTIPADAPQGLAVGASDAVTDAYHTYSSRGPTHDDRIKPDFSAPSGVSVSNLTYGSRATGGFAGTSAAAPHLAGGIILVKGKTPYSLSQVKTILEKRAIDLGPAGKDNQHGIGRLNLKQ